MPAQSEKRTLGFGRQMLPLTSLSGRTYGEKSFFRMSRYRQKHTGSAIVSVLGARPHILVATLAGQSKSTNASEACMVAPATMDSHLLPSMHLANSS